ncbi:unnamed protein product [Camellia sinensis]
MLLTIDDYNKINMHQLLQDMGREIVCQESPKEPGKHSRLWHHKDSFTILREKTGSETIEGLVLDLHAFKAAKSVGTSFSQSNTKAQCFQEYDKSSLEDQGNSLQQYHFGFPFLHRIDTALKNSNKTVLEISAFVRMHKLRLLQLSYVQLSGSYKECPKKTKMVVLEWVPFRIYTN